MSPSSRPQSREARPYHFPSAERVSLANGLTVIATPLPRLPVVTLLAIVDAGAERDSPAQAGLAALTAKVLGEGTRRRSGHQLADAFERLGGEMTSDVTWTRSECETTVLADRVEPTLALLAEVLREPALADVDVERLRDERLAELLQIEAEPRELADDHFARIAFGNDIRDAQPMAGNQISVRRLSAGDVRAFYGDHYRPHTTTLIVAGDVDVQRVARCVEELFGDWEPGAGLGQHPRSQTSLHPRRVHLVPRAGAPQSEIRVGHRSIGRSSADFHAIAVMNAILGGLFNSRINLNLRERHAFTYGAFSSFEWRRHTSLFEVSTAVRSDVTAAAVSEIIGEIERIRDAEVGDSELSLARDYLTGVFPIRFETTAAIAEAIAVRESFGLAPDYYETYRDRIAAISAGDVRAAAEQYLDPDHLQVLVVGDPEITRGPLGGVGMGEPEDISTGRIESILPAEAS
jgi:zinc protease